MGIGAICAAYLGDILDCIYEISKAGNLLAAYDRCVKSSGWKASIQQFGLNLWPNLLRLQQELRSGTYQPGSGDTFQVCERGNLRLVRALSVRDSVVQHSLCDTILVPRLAPYLIHDNGASLKGKGLSFSRRRFEEHLHKFYRHHGRDGYVLLIDFAKFFDNIEHEKLLAAILAKIPDKGLERLLRQIFAGWQMDVSYTDADLLHEKFDSLAHQRVPKELLTGRRFLAKSLAIGSPISQIAGIFYPTPIDTYAKTVMRCKYYGVYMDDRYCIHESKAFLHELLAGIRAIAQRLGIFLNERKTQIVRLTHGFTWLKTRYQLTESGHLVRKIPRKVLTRERRKLKTLSQMEGISIEDYQAQYRAWRGDKRRYDARRSLYSLDLLYERRLRTWTKNR